MKGVIVVMRWLLTEERRFRLLPKLFVQGK
jgi:hypothetical protein